MALARPSASIMRRALLNDLKKHVAISAGIAAVAALGYWQLRSWRKEQYRNFYKTYDEERHFKRMVQAGVFQSVKPDSEAPQWVKDYEVEVDKAIAALKKK